jgi:hypothetical protein
MGFSTYSAYPSAPYGYYRGTPYYQGSGAGQGGTVAGQSTFAQGQGAAQGMKQWHPTIIYLIALTIAEMVIFHILSRYV